MARHPRARCMPRERFETLARPGMAPSFPRQIHRRRRLALAIALCIINSTYGFATESRQKIPIAIVDFTYRDTSGEVRDSTAAHRQRLQAFMDAMRSDIGSNEKFRLVDVACGTGPCSISDSTPADLLDAAKRAGARLLLYGGIHKESTLVQWAKVQVLDIAADKLVVDRLVTFRGDSDEAWRRAEAFIIDEVRNGALVE